MIKQRIHKFIFNHPLILNLIKLIISSKLVSGNAFYQNLIVKKAKNFAKNSREYQQTISIETTLFCNSRCVFCAHHNKLMSGLMSKELYEKIIDECYELGIRKIVFGVYGEFMTDKFMFERIKYLRIKGMKYGFITNASLMNKEIVDELFKLGGMFSVQFSVNGFSKDIYEKTMVGLRKEDAYENIAYFLRQKEKLEEDDLIVDISAVIIRQNKKDFKKLFKFWRGQKGISTIWPIELMDRMGEDYKGKLGELGIMSKKDRWLSPCRFLWGALRVYYDGRVSSCCKDDDKRELIIGDISKESLKEVLNSKIMANLRECHLSGNRKSHPVCGKCYLNSVWFD
jgi:MoaA/NifB/PqqE/SkfB family radical SAM enzyme